MSGLPFNRRQVPLTLGLQLQIMSAKEVLLIALF